MVTLENLKIWYLQVTQPEVINFRSMFMASLFAHTNIALSQLLGGVVIAFAVLLGDDAYGAFIKYVVWQFFVMGLYVIAARHHKHFSIGELDQGFETITDRLIFAGMNFIMVAVWSMSFLDPRFGLFVSCVYSLFCFFYFAPTKEQKAQQGQT